MGESLIINSQDKEQKYQELVPQIKALIGFESNQIANLANVAAALKQTFDWLWVGFYLVDGKTLVLGPFQGPIACTRIPYGKGVCGSSWESLQVLLVDNVNEFPGHIACSSRAQSEIVLPLLDESGNCFGVLDIDSEELANFDQIDEKYLKQIVELLK